MAALPLLSSGDVFDVIECGGIVISGQLGVGVINLKISDNSKLALIEKLLVAVSAFVILKGTGNN